MTDDLLSARDLYESLPARKGEVYMTGLLDASRIAQHQVRRQYQGGRIDELRALRDLIREEIKRAAEAEAEAQGEEARWLLFLQLYHQVRQEQVSELIRARLEDREPRLGDREPRLGDPEIDLFWEFIPKQTRETASRNVEIVEWIGSRATSPDPTDLYEAAADRYNLAPTTVRKIWYDTRKTVRMLLISGISGDDSPG